MSDAQRVPTQDPWLDEFRRRCDPLADDVIEALADHPTGPLLAACERLAAQGQPACRRFIEVTGRLPAWADTAEHAAGRRMFESNGLLALMVGFTVLIDSYAGANDNKVLMMSGRLQGSSAFRRLAETAGFVSDVVAEGALRPGGKGHRAILAVRLLHARVRMLCRAAGYDVQRYDQPINQEAMCGTLMLFSLGVILALEKLGVHVTAAEKRSYHLLWRHAGWLLGVEQALLPETYEGERALYERVKAHQYFPDADTQALFDSAVAGISQGAQRLPLGLQLAGAGLFRSERFLRGLTRYCVDPRMGERLVPGEDRRVRRGLDALWVANTVVSRVRRVPGLGPVAHQVQAKTFRRVIDSLLGGTRATFEDPGFSRVAVAQR